jgi:hypothetical protein
MFMPKPETTPLDPSRDGSKSSDIQQAATFLLTRRWFRRLWVVQESCLAQHIAFVIGDHEFDSGAIVSMVPWLETARKSKI